ncbi:hypothetical protein Tco_0704662, partial [Tanacetum coccineum]
TERSETLVLMYKAAEVVLEKGFDLLGITMESSEITYLKQQNGKLLAMDHYVALPVLSQNLSSRFEIFSMTVGVLDSNFKILRTLISIRVTLEISDRQGVYIRYVVRHMICKVTGRFCLFMTITGNDSMESLHFILTLPLGLISINNNDFNNR